MVNKTRKQKAGSRKRKFSNKRRGGLLATLSAAIVPFGLFGLKKYANKKLRKFTPMKTFRRKSSFKKNRRTHRRTHKR